MTWTETANGGPTLPPPLSNGSTASHSLLELCAKLHDRIEAFLREEVESELLRQVQEQTRGSLGIIHEALRRYPLSSLSLSYNGGKDCLVLLILYLSALYPTLKATTPPPSSISTIYIVPAHPFPEVDAFVDSSSISYKLSCTRLEAHNDSGDGMRDAFAVYLAERKEIEAIFVGTRRTDPHGGALKGFDVTNGGWPRFMRVHPVLEWHYREIWAFIRHLNIPYCSLYDLGYTSLGGTENTHPNPRLKIEDNKSERFKPAYELEGDEEERLGRD